MRYINLVEYQTKTIYVDTGGDVGYIGVVSELSLENNTLILDPGKEYRAKYNTDLVGELERKINFPGRVKIDCDKIVSVFSVPKKEEAKPSSP